MHQPLSCYSLHKKQVAEASTYWAVFSIIGILNRSKYPRLPTFPRPLGMPLICSICSISKQASFPNSRSTSRVVRTAHWECVCMQQPAPRVKAARNSGVQADGLRTCKGWQGLEVWLHHPERKKTWGLQRRNSRTVGLRRYSRVLKSITNMSVGFISSFWTPDGAMKIWS
jgi:hypothetical protein